MLERSECDGGSELNGLGIVLDAVRCDGRAVDFASHKMEIGGKQLRNN